MLRSFPFVVLVLIVAASSADTVIEDRMRHLRSREEREWGDFSAQAEAKELTLAFEEKLNGAEQTLRIRQRDVKQLWRVSLNGKELARLPQDEADMVTFWTVPAGALQDGRNELRVSASGATSDDVMIGQITLINRPRDQVLSEASVEVTVAEEPAGTSIPCRLTIADANGSLISLGNSSDAQMAVRPGVAYTATGKAKLELPAGKYTLTAGRGFEYSVATADLDLLAGTTRTQRLSIRREVETAGYLAMDTHVHTATFARHGDCSIEERMVTIAGEGIELPVSTEHNMLVDFHSHAQKAGVRAYFTPILGSEVTTPAIGHFNVFPIAADGKGINQRAPDWAELATVMKSVGTDPLIILNHGRDVHGGFRPLDPMRHISTSGENLDGWTLPANAMEVINSGAVLSDSMMLLRDWMGMLNRGMRITPVGSSDSHDVSRYIIGQGRTYVRCDDRDPSSIKLEEVMASLRSGNVLVSYGLLTELTVGSAGPGETAMGAGDISARIVVKGPSWSRGERLALYMNGVKVREEAIDQPWQGGIKHECTWQLARPGGDVHLVAVAMGPGITSPHWPTAKPYQPTGIEFTPYSFGASGAVLVDVDGDGKYSSPHEQAKREVGAAKDLAELARRLGRFDQAVAVQAASILRAKDPDGFAAKLKEMIPVAGEEAASGLQSYLNAWHVSASGRKGLAPER